MSSPPPAPRRRGRPRIRPVEETSEREESVSQQGDEDDERVVDEDYWRNLDIDDDDSDGGFEGDALMDAEGNLAEGKEFRVQALVFPARHPTRRYHLIVELSRLLGYGDTYRFFKDKTNRQRVRRVELTDQERRYLANKGLIPSILRNRAVPVMRVTKAYKLYGDRILRSPGDDDPADDGVMPWLRRKTGFHSAANGANGPGAAANASSSASSLLQRNDIGELTSLHRALSTTMLPGLKNAPPPEVNGADWMYRVAADVAEFNAFLTKDRYDRLWNKKAIYGDVQPDHHQDGDNADDPDAMDTDRNKDINVVSDSSDNDSLLSDDSDMPRRKKVRPIVVPRQSSELYHMRNGFYDVHTNIDLVPIGAQPTDIKIVSVGLMPADLGRKLTKEDVLSRAKPQLVGENTNENAPLPNHGKSVRATFGEKYGSGSDSNDKNLYPLSLVPGQYQDGFSIYPYRFGHDDFDPKNARPFEPLPVQQQAPAPMLYNLPPNAARPQLPNQPAYGQPMNQPAYTVQQSMPTPTQRTGNEPILCGEPTVNGQSCRQRVLRHGEKCFAHRSNAGSANGSTSQLAQTWANDNDGGSLAGGEDDYGDARSRRNRRSLARPVMEESESDGDYEEFVEGPACGGCRTSIESNAVKKLHPGIENTADKTTMDYLLATRSFRCVTCEQYYHAQCLDHFTPMIEAKIRTYPWQCNDCKLCVKCKAGGDETKLLICEGCDRSYHTYCLKPAMKEAPDGAWLCELCAKCDSCGKSGTPPLNNDLTLHHNVAAVKSASGIEPKEVFLSTLCVPCHRDFAAQRFCPVCLKSYGEKDDSKVMICCDKCDRWIHVPDCDPLVLGDDAVDDDGNVVASVEKSPKRKKESGGRTRGYLRFTQSSSELEYICPICRMVGVEPASSASPKKKKAVVPKNDRLLPLTDFLGTKVCVPLAMKRQVFV